MHRNAPLQEHIAGEAADWFARLQDKGEAPSLRAEFVQWLLRSPAHLEEFLAVSRVWGEAGNASAERFSVDALVAAAQSDPQPDNVIALAGPHRAGLPLQKRMGASYYAYAASALIGAIAVVLTAWFVAGRWLDPAYIRTAIGEQRSITLADGSVVDVNTNSEVQVSIDSEERRLRLVRGEARFRVAKDPQRPFIVSTPQATVRALGTVFNVRAEPEHTSVTVLEGRVEVGESVQPRMAPGRRSRIELHAGQQAAVGSSGPVLGKAGPSIERVAAWPERRLVFREEPLTDVVAEFNRYHRKPIRIDDPGLGQLRISGTFDSSDPNSLIEYFERFEGVRVEQGDDGIHFFRSVQ